MKLTTKLKSKKKNIFKREETVRQFEVEEHTTRRNSGKKRVITYDKIYR